MILVTGQDTGLPAYIWVNEIKCTESLKEPGSSSPSFTRVYLEDPKQGHQYTLDILESETEIKRRIKEERLDPGCESRTQY